MDVDAVRGGSAVGAMDAMDQAELDLLAETFGKTMAAASGAVLHLALAELGWRDLLASMPEVATPLAFRLLDLGKE